MPNHCSIEEAHSNIQVVFFEIIHGNHCLDYGNEEDKIYVVEDKGSR